MIKFIFILTLFTFYNGYAQDRPNFLWLVCEDMSPYLSSYGNTVVKTPNLDKLAAKGIRFTRAHSNGTQCSPARSTLISGKYGFSLGTDIHREGRPVPEAFYFPIYLRQAGYYCTNFAKEDYNNSKTPKTVWDKSARKATYLDRPDKLQPFFAVFNSHITHMNRVATRTVEGRSPRKTPTGAVHVPAYVPDLPAVRDDIAWNMDAVMQMDKWVGKQLAVLEQSGEADNTIVFFYSDHGGTVPRGKGHVYESGTLVPFIAYFPEKWRHLAGTPLPAVSDRLVSFVDFAPTMLNMAGVDIPDFMVGKVFFGPGADKTENKNKHVFSFRGNSAISYAPARAVTDGHYKLIWNYQSAYPNGARQEYQWQMPAQQAWDIANMNNDVNPLQEKFWQPATTFELYDLRDDSLETHNLASDKRYRTIFNALKVVLQNEIRTQKDLGFIPREYRKTLQQDGPLYDVVRKNKIDINRQIEAAETASLLEMTNLKKLEEFLRDQDPVVQYWGSSGICGLAKAGLLKSLPRQVALVMDDPQVIPEVKCMLAEAMVYVGQEGGLDYLLDGVKNGYVPAMACLQNVGDKAEPIAQALKTWLQTNQPDRADRFYIRSVLINCGALPYTALYKQASPTN